MLIANEDIPIFAGVKAPFYTPRHIVISVFIMIGFDFGDDSFSPIIVK
jgi:hypothetical protein